MKSAWAPDLCDMAAWNTEQVDGVDLFDLEELLSEDVECKAWGELDVVQDDEEAVVADEAVNTAY